MSAGKIALGQGLMAFGSIIDQQMTARERARQSLEEIAARGQIRAQEMAAQQGFQQQQSLEEYKRRQSEIQDERKFQAKQQGLLMEQEAPMRALEMERVRSQIDASDALADYRRRPQSTSAGGPTALQREIPIRFRQEALRVASDQAPVYFGGSGYENVRNLVDAHPEMAQRLGITEETPLNEAMQAVERAIFDSRVQTYQDQFGADSGLLSPGVSPTQQYGGAGFESEIAEAMAAIQRGATVEDIRSELIRQGAPEQEIQAIIEGISR